MNNLAAADITKDVGISSFYNPVQSKIPTTANISEIISGLGLINIIFFVIGIIFMSSLLMAGYGFVNSQGAPENIAKANTRMINSLLGLVITFGAFIIVRLILSMVGGGDVSPF